MNAIEIKTFKTALPTSIPKDWDFVLLDTVAKRGSGHTPNKKFETYYRGDIKWISLADSNKLDKGWITETTYQITNEGIENSSAVLHPKGTVILSRDAGVGKSAVMGTDMAVSQHFIAWRCGKSLDNWFLYYTLQMRKEEFERIAFGSTIKTIGLPYFKKIKILLPPIFEQISIAKLLLTWDKAIEKTTQLITAKEQRKKYLMQHLLTGKKRMKGFTGAWEEYKMMDIFDRVARKNTEHNSTVVTISAQKGFISQEDYFNKIVASDILDNYFLVYKGEFCYNKSYSNGYPWGATKRLNDFDKAVVTTLYICFGIKDYKKHSGEFFEHFFESGILDEGLMKIAHEGGRAHGLLNVTPTDFLNLKITVPEIKEQTAIANILQTADKEINLLKQKLGAYKEQKKGLMQVLLTGKVRLKIKN